MGLAEAGDQSAVPEIREEFTHLAGRVLFYLRLKPIGKNSIHNRRVNNGDRARHRPVKLAVVEQRVGGGQRHGPGDVAIICPVIGHAVVVRVAHASARHQIDEERMPGRVHIEGVRAAAHHGEAGIIEIIDNVVCEAAVGDGEVGAIAAIASASGKNITSKQTDCQNRYGGDCFQGRLHVIYSLVFR